MKFYFVDSAVQGTSDFKFELPKRMLFAYGGHSPDRILKLKDRVPDMLVDSGAFAAWTRGKVIQLEDYCAFLDHVAGEITGYFNLDEIGNAEASRKNYDLMREMGYDAIPIFHYGSDYSYLDYYLEHAKYIGLGGLVGKFRENRKWIKQTMKRIPAATKVHLLGSFNQDILMTSNFYSCDSSECIRLAMNCEVVGSTKQLFKGISRADIHALQLMNIKKMLNREKIITDYWNGRVQQ